MSDQVKVRVAVAINEDGEYEARGSNGWDDGEMTEQASCKLSGTQRVIHFIEVMMPVPKPQTFVLSPSDQAKFQR